ncbi:MAG: PPC domain-containing protein, partial [Actinoplanes sp.]
PLKVNAQGGPLGSSNELRPTIADGESQEFTIEVPAGAQRLDVSIGNASDAAADLDLTVYRGDVQVAQQADGDANEAISLANPVAGTYTVVVDGYAVPSGSTAYDYLDVYYSPALGGVTVPSTVVSLANGASTTITGTVTATSVPPAGRKLFGEVAIVTDEGAVVGRAAVQIGAVTE